MVEFKHLLGTHWNVVCPTQFPLTPLQDIEDGYALVVPIGLQDGEMLPPNAVDPLITEPELEATEPDGLNTMSLLRHPL